MAQSCISPGDTFPSTLHTARPGSVMSGVLLLLLTQGLFGRAFTASPHLTRPCATAVRQESAGEEPRPLFSFPRQAEKTHMDISYTLLERQTQTQPSLFQLDVHTHTHTHTYITARTTSALLV